VIRTATSTAVVEVSQMYRASSKAVVESALSRRPGVVGIDDNPVAQTATVTYDPAVTSVAEIAGWVRECGYRCEGCCIPQHLYDPMEEPSPHGTPPPHGNVDPGHGSTPTTPHRREESGGGEQPRAPGPSDTAGHGGHGGHDREDAHDERAGRSPQDVMGHGGHSVGMSMDDMVRDLRNRFIVAAVLSVPITLWSPIGRDVLNFTADAPFGLRDDVFSLPLSLPVIFYADWIFFEGAYRALRKRTLDMMVLVAVAVGAGWLYSVGVTLTGGGDVFYEAATVLSAFVLLGHWFEMRARGGANDAIRTLLELAPPMAVVLRDGEPVEVPTAEVQVGDLLLIRPGAKIPVDAVVGEGVSEVDESVVTGESLPVTKAVGDELIGGSINTTGTL